MNHTVDMINSVMRRKVKSEFWRVLSSPEEDNRDQPQVPNKIFVHLVLFLHDQLILEKKKETRDKKDRRDCKSENLEQIFISFYLIHYFRANPVKIFD